MARWITALTLSILLLSPISRVVAQEAPPPSPTVKAAFEKAIPLLQAKKYSEALEQLKIVLKESPEQPGALWNAGMASYAIKDYAAAKTYYNSLKKLTPNDGFLRSKLIQTYQALGDKAARDKERMELLELHQSKKDDSRLAKDRSFCRDRFFTEKGQEVFVYEVFTFEPRNATEGRFATRYQALVAGQNEQLEQTIDIGWNFVKKNGKGEWIPEGELSAFYFDAYPKTGPDSRITYGLFLKELSYDEVHNHLIQILAGKVRATGHTVRKNTPEK
ncbi:MAG: hypothetical protein QM758_20825 [Armatimonas sp.]